MNRQNNPADRTRREAGFSMIELIMVLLVGSILTVCAIPTVASTIKQYRLRSAVAGATWAIQSVRFQSLMEGYPFQVTFQGNSSGINPSYQIASKPSGATSYSNVGSSIPLSGSPVTLTAATVVQFQPNGTVAITQGGTAVTSMQITYSGYSDTITVSNYGNVSITSP
jgi:prepilin-type N-terminal cleavage/methylation domain-containing protein